MSNGHGAAAMNVTQKFLISGIYYMNSTKIHPFSVRTAIVSSASMRDNISQGERLDGCCWSLLESGMVSWNVIRTAMLVIGGDGRIPSHDDPWWDGDGVAGAL